MVDFYQRENHIFSLEGRKFLFEVNTLRTYEIDDLMADLFALPEPLNIDKVISHLSPRYDAAELRKLWNLLVSEQLLLTEKEDVVVDLEKRKEFMAKTIYLNALVINVAQKCNLRCIYCYADHGVYNGPEQSMNRETAEASIDLLLAATEPGKGCFAIFFGGEPLLNFEVIKHAVQYGEERAVKLGINLRFGITTNGTLLTDSIIDFFDEHKFSIVVSIDGPQELQDAQRPLVGGKGSYERIVPWLEKLKNRKGLNFGCRSTITPQNIDLQALDNFFITQGIQFYHIELATVGPHMQKKEAAKYLSAQLDDFIIQYGDIVKRVWQRIQAKTFVGFRTIFYDLVRLENRNIWYAPCGMGTKVLLVDAGGEIYACHRLVGMKEHILGSVFDKNVVKEIRRFRPVSIAEKEGCLQCWARNICAGDCPAESIIINGDECKPVPHRCLLRQKRLEWTIWLYSMIRTLPDSDLSDRILSQEFIANGLYD